MKKMIFDAHCDTVYELAEQDKKLACSDLHLDLSRMEEYDGYIQVFAAFVDRTDIRCSPMNHCIALLERMHREIAASGGRIALIQNVDELAAVAEHRGLEQFSPWKGERRWKEIFQPFGCTISWE